LFLKFATQKKRSEHGHVSIIIFPVRRTLKLPKGCKRCETYKQTYHDCHTYYHIVMKGCLVDRKKKQCFFYCRERRRVIRYNGAASCKISSPKIVLQKLQVMYFVYKKAPAGPMLPWNMNAVILHHYLLQLAWPPIFSCSLRPQPYKIIRFKITHSWHKEPARTKCSKGSVNKNMEIQELSSQLPNVCVVPRDLLDGQLEAAAQHFQGMRPPVWCWGIHAGAALVRMAQISPSIQDKSQENRMMGLVHRCHPKKLQPTILDLDQILPSHREVTAAYNKLRDLHTPDDVVQYREQDSKYLSRWDSSKWLSYVSKCLETAQKAAVSMLHHNSSVILQDAEGRDLSTVISSLIQILLDPWWRTLRGFHMLLQKEWVSLGHPFTKRLGHTRNDPEEQSPLWLLFLDCVFQISIQHPRALEFTSEYLVALWGAAHCSLHSTFMFNSVNAKLSAIYVLQRENPQEPVYLSPAWAWWATEASGGRTHTERGLSQMMEENGQNKNGVELRSNGKIQTTFCGNTREAFLNVHYISQLIESLMVGGALERVNDTVSSAHHTWQRLCYLMEDGGSQLPYDATAQQTTLQLDNIIRVDASTSGLVPWQDCFSRWLTEPALLPMAASESSPCNISHTAAQLWQNVYYMYDTLKAHLQPNLVNGSVK
ncbi:unnamed protein product, partial [Meganyctiphanes norvegica]